ncbi:PIG-L family deacetylase [Paenibacillus sp. OV219]|uniref:PIG-L family deacetylase n=1 Tax=Paenibacillus sp. OV219 TaxID=1884377 RepID=UPI0008BCE17F|nr:PIG-L family deacetylase [Paenibacillus sp. OV219]SEN95636.1 bacillithiol biosynthesis deacetylase BshB2 [Paenibacillus sp. OV219]
MNHEQAPKRKLLAVFAHPDDESFICGGTLAKYASEGVEITLVSATKGDMGRRMGNPPYLNRESMALAREQELREACDCLGIGRLIFFGIRDKTVEFEDEASLIERIEALIREVEPDVVLTFHEQYGGHPDHCAIGKAATAAFRRSADKSKLYFITFGDALEHPEKYKYTKKDVVRIDVQAHNVAKLAAFRAHRCQTEIDEWVWQSDKAALSRFGKYEYFLKGDVNTPQQANDDLF